MTISTRAELEAAVNKKEILPFYMATLTTVVGTYAYNPFHNANIVTSRDIPNVELATPGLFSAGGTSYSNGSMNIKHSGYANAYLAGVEFFAASSIMIEIYDRLWSCSGLGLTATTEQVFTSFPVLDRYENDYNLDAYLEIYTTMANTAAITATIKYTDYNNVADKTTTAIIPINAVKGTLIPIYMGNVNNAYARDKIKVIQSVTLSAAGTAGNFGITIMRNLGNISNIININGPTVNLSKMTKLGWAETGLSRIDPNACICPILKPSGTSTGVISGNFIIARD